MASRYAGRDVLNPALRHGLLGAMESNGTRVLSSRRRNPSDEEVLEAFARIRQGKRFGEIAPHKPLLLLIALARLQRGEERLIEFEGIEPWMKRLLVEFGPPRKSQRLEYPFWRLLNDGLWEIPQQSQLQHHQNASGDVSRKHLVQAGASGGFPEPLFEALRTRQALVSSVVGSLLEDNWEPSFHQDILDAVGMPCIAVVVGRRRDPSFRSLVLRNYEYRCAICGFDGRLGDERFGVEAAHVMEHSAGGPDDVSNGLALCAFHHKAYDRGAVSLDENLRILVSREVHGGSSVEEWLLRYSGSSLRGPQAGTPHPAEQFTRWHRENRFRAPARPAH